MTSSHDYDEKLGKNSDTARSVKETEAIDPAFRARTGTKLGRELEGVRIHAGPAAQAEAEERNALAFTRGRDIYFARDEYRPGTVDGDRLLAHELAHTIQQSGTGADVGSEKALEGDAEQAARAVADGSKGRIGLSAPYGTVQRQDKGKTETPTIRKHPDEVHPIPAQGTVTGAGMTISYHYTSTAGAGFVNLSLQLPDGVALAASPVTNLREGADFNVRNATGTRARSVVISVNSRTAVPPKLQVTFNRGSAGYVVVFQFPASAERK